jgi:5-methylthioribose kinase
MLRLAGRTADPRTSPDQRHSPPENAPMTTIPVPAEYERLDHDGVRRWLAELPSLSARVGGAPDAWRISEVGDGNLNVVYVVTGSAGGVCVKQSLPYVRVAGESWPMPLERAYFEQLYLRTCEPYVNRLAPVLFHYDPQRFAMAMELLAEHIIMRRGLIAGQRYPLAARSVADYIARRGFATSVLAVPFEEANERLAAFSQNHALLRITVDLIFTHPYVFNERSRWTTPQLDEVVAALQADAELKVAVARLGHRFLTVHETLLHGDLHTGSVMVTATDTRVIDAEFAAYGPIGFDLGLFVGNLLMAYFSQPGHESRTGERLEYGEWILVQVGEFWHEFVAKFDALWSETRAGDAYPSPFFATPSDSHAFAQERQRWFGSVLADTLGYAGAEIIRRIVGFAHNLDFESIDNPDLRSCLEQRALAFARKLIVAPQNFNAMNDVLRTAREHG